MPETQRNSITKLMLVEATVGRGPIDVMFAF